MNIRLQPRLQPRLIATTLLTASYVLGAPFAIGQPALRALSPPAQELAPDEVAAEVEAAREVFERNVQAIQHKDREAYLSCYRASERLVRVGPDGFQLGFDELRDGTPATGSKEWPERLVARDIQLAWLSPGLVYGTYRYRAVFDGLPADGISGRLIARGEDGAWRIRVTSAFGSGKPASAAPVALVGATLHTGDGGPPIPDALVVLRDGKIAALGPRAETELPADVDVIDLGGRFLVPGLIDTHVHYSQTGWADGRPDASDQRADYPYELAMADNRRHPERFHKAFLHAGVTAVFDVGGYPWTRSLGADTEDSHDAPHVAATGPLLATVVPDQLRLPEADQLLLMESEKQARALVRNHVAQGSDAIKVWFVATDPELFEQQVAHVLAVGDEARKLGIPLVVHATELETARVAVAAGAQLLVHSVGDKPVDQAFLDAALASGVIYCPTLTVQAGYYSLYLRQLSDELRAQLEQVDASVRERVLATEGLPVEARFLDASGSTEAAARMLDARLQFELETVFANLRAVHQAGIPIALGTDAGNPLTLHGPSVFPELEAMAAAGLEPLEVLTAATRDAARAMGRGDDLGLLEVGRIADLVVLEQDPALSVENLRAISHVIRAGFVHEREWLRP